MQRLSPLDRLLLLAIALLLAVIAARGVFPPPLPAAAQNYAAPAPEQAFPIRIANATEIGGSVAAFPTDTQGRFVVVDGANRRMLFCEVVWTGPEAALMIRKTTDF